MHSTVLASHDVVGVFAEVATRGPIEALLFLCGAVLVAVAMGVFGGLTLGGLLAVLRRPIG